MVNMLLDNDFASSTTRGSVRRDFPSCDFDLLKDEVERLIKLENWITTYWQTFTKKKHGVRTRPVTSDLRRLALSVSEPSFSDSMSLKFLRKSFRQLNNGWM